MAMRHNILFIMSDQQRADMLGSYGDASARTEATDWLASEGLQFEYCFCQAPLCMPSRASMLGERMRKHDSQVYLINTGWSGGPFGIGQRMDIDITRALVNCALCGILHDVEYKEDPLFHIAVPRTCPSVPTEILNPRNTWEDKEAFDLRARKLAADFSTYFDKAYGTKGIDREVIAQCPGK